MLMLYPCVLGLSLFWIGCAVFNYLFWYLELMHYLFSYSYLQILEIDKGTDNQ